MTGNDTVSETDPKSAENAGFTGMGFTGDAPAPDDGDFDLSDDSPLLGEEPAVKKGKGALVLILVVGVAAGSLFSMHTLTKRTAAGGVNLDIERTVDSFLSGAKDPKTGELVDGHQEIVSVLENNYAEYQVDLERNPFTLLGGGPKGERPGAGLNMVERAFAKLNLKSVMGGSRPLANLNGRIVRINQVIPVALSKREGDVKFRVTQITRESITVEAVGVDLAKPFIRVVTLKRNR